MTIKEMRDLKEFSKMLKQSTEIILETKSYKTFNEEDILDVVEAYDSSIDIVLMLVDELLEIKKNEVV